jgi:hypothetical protein
MCPSPECTKEFVFETNEGRVFAVPSLCSSTVTSSARNCIDLSLANPGTLLPLTAVRPTPSSLGQKSVIGTQLLKA